jgi:hypothetical protein
MGTIVWASTKKGIDKIKGLLVIYKQDETKIVIVKFHRINVVRRIVLEG